ncbi:hypothetical protein ACX1C1_20520 [Paenibacillus sp. strain BS8-2]
MYKKYNLEGMTEEELIEVLGEPAETLDEPSRQLLYFVGYAGSGVKVSLLQFQFDEQGKLDRHDIIYK